MLNGKELKLVVVGLAGAGLTVVATVGLVEKCLKHRAVIKKADADIAMAFDDMAQIIKHHDELKNTTRGA